MSLSPTSSHSGGASALVAAYTKGDNTGNLTTTSASFVDLTGMSATVAAAVGDRLWVVFAGSWSNTSTTGAAQFVTKTTTGGNNIAATSYVAGVASKMAAVVMAALYTVVSGDISSGNVAVKVQFASDGAATLTVQNASAYDPTLTVINLSH